MPLPFAFCSMKVFLLPLLLLSPSSVDATNHNTFADPISQLIINPTSRFGKIDIGTTTYETSYNVDAYAKGEYGSHENGSNCMTTQQQEWEQFDEAYSVSPYVHNVDNHSPAHLTLVPPLFPSYSL